MSDEPQIYRYGRVWEAIGWLFMLLALLFPALMWLNHERFTAPLWVMFVSMATFGGLTVYYYRAHCSIVTGEILTLHRPFRPPVTYSWRDIIAVSPEGERLRFQTISRQQSFLLEPWDPAFRAIVSEFLAHHPEAVLPD